MSIIGKKPFAEQVLNALSGPQISRLATLVNNLGAPLKMDIHALSKGANEVEYVRLTFNKELAIAKEGFLCYISNDLCGFFSFQNDTDSMISYKIRPSDGAYTDMHELLTADEFRRIIDDALESHPEYADKITVGKIDSEDAVEGKAIISDGQGGAKWGDVANCYEVSNITAISKKILDVLKPGDIVNKKTGNDKHSYRVSYKGEGAGTGICLTYTAAGYSETVSYDRSGNDWVYNSTDVSSLEECAKVHHYNEADILTEEILNLIKDGDVICVNQMPFVIKKTNLTTHYIIQGGFAYIAGGDPYIVLLSWDSSDDTTGLTLTSAKLALGS